MSERIIGTCERKAVLAAHGIADQVGRPGAKLLGGGEK